MGEKAIRIAILRKANNLENDDRIRKEVDSIKRLFPHVSFKCFVMMDENKAYESVTSYGLPFKSVHLKSREQLASGKHLLAKTWEYYRCIRKDLKDCDIVWISGDAPAPVILLISGKKIIWDLRELPLFMMGGILRKTILKRMFQKCSILFHANQYRIEYLKQHGYITAPEKHVPLYNFPEFSKIDSEYDDRYHEVKLWIGDRTCVYLQGLSADARAAVEVVSAVMETPELCAIVLGNCYADAIETLKGKYGSDELEKRICFAGNFKVLKVPQYMALCHLSLVFYKNVSPNNYYCEPNRLYQAIEMGLPVVVGSNPPMKSVVEKYDVGISVDTDGSDVEKIKEGIREVLSKREHFLGNIEKMKGQLYWPSQEPAMQKALETILK